MALATPATVNYEVDVEKLRENVRSIVDAGIRKGDGILMVAGGRGEGYFLDKSQFKTVVDVLADEAKSDVATAAGVFELNTKHAIERIKYAEDRGIDFIQCALPRYLRPLDEEIFRHFKMINDAIEEIGVFIYHLWSSMPVGGPEQSRQGYELSIPLLERLSALENIVGFKWSSQNFHRAINGVVKLRDKCAILDNMGFASVMVEQVGDPWGVRVVHSSVPIEYDPKTVKRLAELYVKGKYGEWLEEDRKAGRKFRELSEEIGKILPLSLGGGTHVKTLLALIGKSCGPPFPPQKWVTKEQMRKLKETAHKLGFNP